MLKKPLIIAMFASYATSQSVYAHTSPDHSTLELDRIVVSATKTERDIAKTPVSTAVITQADIENIGAKSLKDIFQNMPGVFMNPSADKFSIRGVGGKGTLLLIDGRRIGGEYSNVYDSNRISANSIERIEIVKGPAGALYGSSALGGVINIITKKPEQGVEGSIGISTGANTDGDGDITQIDADLRGRNGNTAYSAWFSAQDAGAYTDNDSAQIKAPKGGGQPGKTAPSMSNFKINPNNNMACGMGANCPAPFSKTLGDLVPNSTAVDTTYQSPAELVNIGGQLTHDVTQDLTLKLNASYMKETREFDRVGGAHLSNYRAAGNQLPIFNAPIHQELDNQRTDIGIGADFKASETVVINWQSSQSHYEKDDLITTHLWQQMGYASEADSASLNGTGESTMTNHQLNGTWTPSEQHRILIGAEHVEDKRKAAFFSGGTSIDTKTLRTSSAFAQHEWQLNEPLSVVYGLRYDDHNKGDDAITFNAGGVYQINPLANLRMRYSQGFRSPDSQELFMNRVMPSGKQMLGVEVVDSRFPGKQVFELDEERSQNYEIGLQGQGSDWGYDIAAFKNRINDSILFDDSRLGSEGYRTFRNASKVDITGLELTLTKQVSNDLSVGFYASVLNTKDHDTDERLEYTPNHQYNLAVNYQVTPALNSQLIARHVGDQIYLENNQYQTADAYTPVNLKLNYSPEAIKNTDFHLGIDNIFDAEVDKVLGSSVGTYVYAGVRVHF